MRYSATSSGETLSRTIGGLNIGAGGGATTGPNRDVAIGYLIETLGAFTSGTNSNWRYITETAVIV